MANSILDKTYTVNQSGGVVANRVVTHTNNAHECAYPAGAAENAGTPVGVTLEDADDGAAVAVRKAGIALVEAASAISVGDMLEVADTSGRVASWSADPSSITLVVGHAETAATDSGDLIEVFINPHWATELV